MDESDPTIAHAVREAARFPVTLRRALSDCTRLPVDASSVLYHYTSRDGLDGILRSGGLRGTYRLNMNDAGEFSYARAVVQRLLDDIAQRDLSNAYTRLARECQANLSRMLSDSIHQSAAYCACLSVRGDQASQWKSYADGGKGFALGIDMLQVLNVHRSRKLQDLSHIYAAPVLYESERLEEMIWDLFKDGSRNIRSFGERHSKHREALTVLYRRIVQEVLAIIITFVDFVKHPSFANEREIRLVMASNNGTFEACDVKYWERHGISTPYLFFDLRDPATGRVALAEVLIGPEADHATSTGFLEDLLDSLGYGCGYADRPAIVQSSLAHSEMTNDCG